MKSEDDGTHRARLWNENDTKVKEKCSKVIPSPADPTGFKMKAIETEVKAHEWLRD